MKPNLKFYLTAAVLIAPAGAANAAQAQCCGPFGGFFRNLFGGQSCQSCQSYGCQPCAAVARQACPTSPNAASETCPGGTCLINPVEEYEPKPCEACEKPKGHFVVPDDPGVPPYFQPDEDDDEPTDDSDVCPAPDGDSCEPCQACQTCGDCSELEARLIRAAIRARGRELKTDGRLCSWARYNSSLQAQYGRVGHFAGGAWEIATPGRTPEEAVNAWLGSAPHRSILMGAFSKIGAGCCRSYNGQIYWTLRFE